MAVLLILPIIAIFAFALYVYFVRWRAEKLRDSLGYKGPPIDSRLAGNFPSLKSAAERYNGKMYKLFEEWREKYGDVYAYLEGRNLKVVFADPDCAQDVLIKQHNCFTDRMELLLEEGSSFYPSIIHLKGEQWKAVRSLLTPVFSTGKLKLISNVMQDKTDKFLRRITEEMNNQKTSTMDIYELFQALTTDVIGKTAFAIDTRCQEDRNDPFNVKTREIFAGGAEVFKSIPFVLSILLPEFSSFMHYFRRFTRIGVSERALFEHVSPLVQQRKQHAHKFQGVDVLQILIEQQEELRKQQKLGEVREHVIKKGISRDLTDQEIISNAFVFLLAGYETTSTALGFSAWLLAKHTEVQKKLQTEIDASLAPAPMRVDYETVMHRMPYLNAVFHECLRVFPPVTGFVVRTCVQECDVYGHKMLPGMMAAVPTTSMHLNPSLWENPEVFDPERFLNGNTHHPLAWLPFGAGPRNCIGLRFAEMEYKIALCKLLREFNLALGNMSEDPLKAEDRGGIIYRPVNGVYVDVTKRDV